MQISRAALPILPVLQGFGLNRHIRGWNPALSRLFPHDRQEVRYLTIRRWGLAYLANPANYIDWNVLCFGGYEREDLELFRTLGTVGATCLDIGANVGHHSLFFASLGWTVHAFEPNPQLWGEFERKVAVGRAVSVTLHKVGLGHEESLLQFEIENATNSGTGRFIADGLRGNDGLQRLPVRNGDRYLSDAEIGPIDVIKMDIQGFEPEALLGLRETILRDRPLISVEIAPDNAAKFGSFEGFLNHLPTGYSTLHTRPKVRGPVRQVETRKYDGEAFLSLSTNLFCVPSG